VNRKYLNQVQSNMLSYDALAVSKGCVVWCYHGNRPAENDLPFRFL